MKRVCTGTTGHAEVIKVIFEKHKLPLDSLFKVFWESHDPTQLNRRGQMTLALSTGQQFM